MSGTRTAILAMTLVLGAIAGCGSDETSSTGAGGDASGPGTTGAGASGSGAAGANGAGATGGGATTGPGSGGSGAAGAGGAGTGGSSPVTAADLLALVGSCNVLPGSTKFKTDSGAASTVDICTLTGAVFWQADLDVDCDGGQGAICQNDPYYLPDTSATDSQGNPLDASSLPFVVVPLPSNGFDFQNEGLELGTVCAVVYGGMLQYGILGDEGPKGIIGEASYAMAEALGIDPDPETGGADSGATYICFTGPSGVVTANEDHGEAEQVGAARAAELVKNN